MALLLLLDAGGESVRSFFVPLAPASLLLPWQAAGVRAVPAHLAASCTKNPWLVRPGAQNDLQTSPFMTTQGHEHRARPTAGKCFCTVPFQAKVPQPMGLQFKMSPRNVLRLQRERGIALKGKVRPLTLSRAAGPALSKQKVVCSEKSEKLSEKKKLNDAELSSSSGSCSTRLGGFETPVSSPLCHCFVGPSASTISLSVTLSPSPTSFQSEKWKANLNLHPHQKPQL